MGTFYWTKFLKVDILKCKNKFYKMKSLLAETMNISASNGWSGLFWGRNLQCLETGSAPPVTLAEFVTLDNSLDYYDVSQVEGFNIPISIEALTWLRYAY